MIDNLRGVHALRRPGQPSSMGVNTVFTHLIDKESESAPYGWPASCTHIASLVPGGVCISIKWSRLSTPWKRGHFADTLYGHDLRAHINA